MSFINYEINKTILNSYNLIYQTMNAIKYVVCNRRLQLTKLIFFFINIFRLVDQLSLWYFIYTCLIIYKYLFFYTILNVNHFVGN